MNFVTTKYGKVLHLQGRQSDQTLCGKFIDEPKYPYLVTNAVCKRCRIMVMGSVPDYAYKVGE